MQEKVTVSLADVSIGYKSRHGQHVVASGISAEIRSGELTCLLGRNGVGKSTLLRTLSGFQPRLGGTVTLCGRPFDDFSSKELAQMLGVVLTERTNVQQMTVWELVAMGRAPYTDFWGRLDAADRGIVAEAIGQVGVDSLSRRMVSTLSDGERQKVMIAKALAQQTPLIFLDEPTAFLDYPSKVETLLLLRRICRESQKTIFLSTHDLELALQVADCLWLMESPTPPRSADAAAPADGNIRLTIGTPRQLADDGVLARFVEQGRGVSFDAEKLTVSIKKSAV